MLSAATPTTAPAGPAAMQITWPQLLTVLICVGTVAIGATLAAWLLGAWRRSVQGPPRIHPGASAWPIILALFAAIAGIFVGGGLAGAFVRVVDGRELFEQIINPPSAIGGDGEVASHVVVRRMQISAISYVCAVVLALVALWLARLAGWRGGIGIRLLNLPRGVLHGLLAALLVIPWMMTASVLFQLVLKAVDVQVEAMHELIRAIRDHPEPALIGWGLFSATILAPVAEEVLFRGVLQTSLVTIWARLFERPVLDQGRGFDVVMSPEPAETAGIALPPPAYEELVPASSMPVPTGPVVAGAVPHPLGHRPAPAPPRRYAPSALARWSGIVLASILFAVMHEPWSIPLIFILALALGYLYERTGNLWTCIALHFAFNSFNMLLILPVLLQ